MVCIYCGAKTQVINSRLQKRQNHIWRRRQCNDCSAVFTTSEIPDYFLGLAVKHKTNVQAFSRDKLFLSIHDSLKHRKSAHADATGLTDTIISKLYPLISQGGLKSTDISTCVISILRNFDKPAATHYLAYHPLP